MRIIDKKGFWFGEEGIGLIIAAVAILILILLVVALSNIFRANTDMEKAEAHMERISNIIKDLEREGGERDYILISPNNWVLTAWPFVNLKGEKFLPDKCNEEWKNCICFCKLASSLGEQVLSGRLSGAKGVEEACEKEAICNEIKQKEFIVNGKRLFGVGIFPEKSNPILINDLIEEGKSINIKLENDKLEINSR